MRTFIEYLTPLTWLLYLVAGHFLGLWGATWVGARLAKAGVEPSSRHQLVQVVYPAVMVLALAGALAWLGFPPVVLAVAIALMGAPLALGAKRLASTVYAGHWVLSNRPYCAGDRITIASTTGTVLTITATSTTLVDDAGAVATITHDLTLTCPIVNHGQPPADAE